MPESVSAKYRKPGSFIDEVLAGLRLAIDHALDALDDLVPYQVNRRTGVDGGVIIYRHVGTDTASGVDETDGAKGTGIIKHPRVFVEIHQPMP